MTAPARVLAAVAAIIICGTLTASAQWRDVVTKVPLTPAGAPNLAAPAPRLGDGKTPDFSGIWDAEKIPCTDQNSQGLGCLDALQGIPASFVNIAGGFKEVLPMQPWAAALVKQRMADGGKDDPLSRCLPYPAPRQWSNFQLQKIIQTPDSLTILDEYMLQFRQIFLDGRRLPKDPEPSFKGYSVGRWDGDVLLIETIGFKDDLWLDAFGHPLTAQARTIERIRRPNYGSLEVQLMVDDPKAYTKPWTTTIRLSLALNTDLLEYICNENEKSRQHMVGADAGK
jgi:hypothetical protein